MKHLKSIFEENKLFWEVTEDEYEDNLRYSNKLTQGEINNLDKVLTQEELSYEIRENDNRKFYINYNSVNISIHISDSLLDDISLYKLEDDWFYVMDAAFYYKCDQWDGLLECIKYIIKQEIIPLIKHYLYND